MSRCPAALFLAIGSPFLPPQGSAWAVIFIWAVAGTSGYLAEKARPKPLHACCYLQLRGWLILMPHSSSTGDRCSHRISLVRQMGTGGLSMGHVHGAGAQFQVPGAMGMILSGMLLRNVGGGLAIAGLKASWSKQIRGAALAIIFLRSGLEIDLDVSALHCLRGGCLCA